MPRTRSVDDSLLEAALEGLELQRQRLDEQIRQVRARLGHRPGRKSAAKDPAAPVKASGRAPRRKLSEEARRRIAAAQKKRWAAFRRKTAAATAS